MTFSDGAATSNVSIDQVAGWAASLPEVTVGARHGNRTWFVGGRAFAWERPFSKADLKRFGDATPPAGPIVAIGCGDLAEKAAILQAEPDGFFTIAHFDGFSAVLIDLSRARPDAVRDAVTDGWLAAAPAALVAEHFPHGV